MRRERGFTLIEALVVLVIGVIIAGGLMFILSGSRRTSRIAEIDAQSQQNARVAIDIMIRDLRSNGYGIDVGQGQLTLAHAGPYDVIFNANINPETDQGSTPGYPAAINTGSYPSSVPPGGVLYRPNRTYDTGAETIRFTFDSNNDGMVSSDDRSDDTIEQTDNPFDYALIRQVYGYDGSSNGGANEEIALLRGPEPYDDGSYPPPLFSYWYDHDDDESTADRLWGDNSGNGELESGEIAALTPVSGAILGSVSRIEVTAIGSARAPDPRQEENQGYRETTITSEVSVTRSRMVRAAYIRGIVFNDVNGDGSQGSGEGGLGGVLVRLNNGARYSTNSHGYYLFRVDPGTYTVTEYDPSGYTSTTPNAQTVTATKGAIAVADFGDRALGGYGTILGRVWLWDSEGGGDLAQTEQVIPGVEVHLNSGEHDTTDNSGWYGFMVPISTYSITMVVPDGFAAVGEVTVDRTLAADGDTAMVDFGLMEAGATGTIRGTVFLDEDEDGIFDAGEPGIPSVSLRLSSGDSTLTDSDGKYSFTVQPGTYDIEEEDLGGFMSTTINRVTDLLVQADSTVVVNFGDILEADLSFTVITLGETQRALCITSTDLDEDNRGDTEIILGTKYAAGYTNLNVWFNNWKNSTTPNSAIFNQSPTYSRTPSEDILSIDAGDIDGDGVDDILTGLTYLSGKVLTWLTGSKGQLSDTPDDYFISAGNADVWATKLYYADTDGSLDAIIGTEYTYPWGRFEVWFGDGGGSFTHDAEDIYQQAGLYLLSSVRDVAVASIVGNNDAPDVVLGTRGGDTWGRIVIFRDNGAPNGKFTYYRSMIPTGAVNALALADMKEDGHGDIDIIVGTRISAGTGGIEIWHNNGDGTFGLNDGFGEYRASDRVTVAGEVLCIGIDNFNGDVYPDIVAGVKLEGTYSGEIKVFPCYGFMPAAGSEWTSPNTGEAITLTINDFNNDWEPDMAVGTRTSSSRGQVVVFFND
jgi:prepilin-type N-terminal cleavage/methylation domain-containing protein